MIVNFGFDSAVEIIFYQEMLFHNNAIALVI